MGQLDVRRTYADGFNLLKQDLDAFVDDIETFVNLTKLNDDNFQDASITASSKFVAGSVTNAKLTSGTLTATELASDCITNVKLAPGAVDSTAIGAGAVTTGKVQALAITAAKILDANITDIKIGSTIVSTAFTVGGDLDIFNSPVAKAAVTITATSERPVLLTITGNSGTRKLRADHNASSGTSLYFYIIVGRVTGGVSTFWMAMSPVLSNQSSSGDLIKWHAPGFCFVDDAPGIGTHVYSLYYGKSASGPNTCSGQGTLLAMEL